MAAAGTLLSDLDGSPGGGGGDGDLVQKILSDMNIPVSGGQPGGRPIPPPMPVLQPPAVQQMAGTHAPLTMDTNIPTSHMIGNDHPTPADFAAAMVGMSGQRPMEYASAGGGGYPMGQAVPGSPAASVAASYGGGGGPSKNMYSRVIDEMKVPFVVALLFFLFSLPPIRVLFAHYMPSMIRGTGEFTLVGLFLVSAIVGALFWVLQRVIAPLLSF